MANSCPPVDKRSFDEVVEETESLASTFTSWARRSEPDLGSALIRIFGRMSMQIIDRINQIPSRNFLAFLNMIGSEPVPVRSARAPLTFRAVEGVTRDVLVPAGTRVAAARLPGERDEVVFETTNDLVVSRAKLVTVWVHDPDHDRFADRTARASGLADGFYSVFEADTPIVHDFYVPVDRVNELAANQQVSLVLRFASAAERAIWSGLEFNLAADVWNGSSWEPVGGMAGEDFAPASRRYRMVLPSSVPTAVQGRLGHWLRVRLNAWPIVETTIPRVQEISFLATVTGTGIAPELALQSGRQIDLGMDFFPLGEQPKFNDTFYLAHASAFSRAGAMIQLSVTPSAARAPIGAGDNPTIVWEAFDGRVWVELGRSTKAGVAAGSPASFTDETRAMTAAGATITFILPATTTQTAVQGLPQWWIRARLVAGDYGKGILVTNGTVQNDGYRPPILKSVTLGFTHNVTIPVDRVLVQTGTEVTEFSKQDLTQGFVPFKRGPTERPALYLGFDQPFAARAMTLYVQVAPLPLGVAQEEKSALAAEVLWEQATPSGWTPIGVEDETEAFSRSGLVRFVGATSFQLQDGVGSGRAWVRARWSRGEFLTPPRMGRIWTNAMWATHAATIRNEILGSSRHVEGQTFQVEFTPVLAGQKIEVREPTMPLPNEIREIERQEGRDAVTVVMGENGDPQEIWVRWHAVPDFRASGPEDRHYTIDRATGEIGFGDGRYGKIPPRGIKNIRAAWYQTGGGAAGNRPAGTIAELKTAIPYIDGVTNVEASTGGADSGGAEGFKERAPRMLRHGGRAVTVEDFEDLAREASPAVARARAVVGTFDPGRLADTPPDQIGTLFGGSGVHLLIVPHSVARCPAPTVGLLRDVETYLRQRCSPAVSLRLSGPDWIQVSVTATVVVTSLEGVEDRRRAVNDAITGYLHPLTGGDDGHGWVFGRLPRPSDLYPLLTRLDGVEFLKQLDIEYLRPTKLPDDATTEVFGGDVDPDAPASTLNRVLVFSGIHEITVMSLAEVS